MEKIFEQTLLYDFYGELLNDHQRKVYEDAVFNDLSLSEIAAEYDISRQAAHDLIKRVDGLLKGYEQKLHMVEKYKKAERLTGDLKKITEGLDTGEDTVSADTFDEIRARAESIADDIMTALY